MISDTRAAATIEEVAAALRAGGYVETAAEATSRSYRPAAWG